MVADVAVDDPDFGGLAAVDVAVAVAVDGGAAG